MNFVNSMLKNTGLLIGLGFLAFVLLVGIGLYNKANNIQKTAVAMEKPLNAQYQDNQAELSKFQSGFYEQMGIADAKSARMDQILADAVSGRYENGSQGQGGQFFSAMVEAYPDLAGLNIYDKVLDYVAAGRQSYKEQQTKLLDMISAYETWMDSGIIHSRLVSMMGVPTQGLEARINTKVLKGEAALDQMKLIVTTSTSQQAYNTGTMEPMTIAPPAAPTTTTPAPTTTTPAPVK